MQVIGPTAQKDKISKVHQLVQSQLLIMKTKWVRINRLTQIKAIKFSAFQFALKIYSINNSLRILCQTLNHANKNTVLVSKSSKIMEWGINSSSSILRVSSEMKINKTKALRWQLIKNHSAYKSNSLVKIENSVICKIKWKYRLFWSNLSFSK